MKGSGVNVITIDESFQSFDTTNLAFMVPMMTKRGAVKKLTTVTGQNFKEKVGYDLAFNSNYLGLSQLLNAVSRVEVMRINKDPKYGNVVIFADGSYYQTDDVVDFDALTAVQCLRDASKSTAAAAFSGSVAETVKPGSLKIVVAGVVWAHDNGAGGIVGDTGHLDITGTVNYTTGEVTVNFAAGYTSGTLGFQVQYIHNTDVALVIAMESPGDWDKLAIKVARYFETYENFATTGSLNFTLSDLVLEGSGTYRLEDVTGAVLATSGAPVAHVAPITGTGITGSINFTTGAVSLTFDPGTFPAAGFPKLLKHRYNRLDAFYSLEVYRRVEVGVTTTYQLLESKRISLDASLEDFVEEVEFDNIIVNAVGALSVMKVGDPTPIDLLYGDNGSMPSSAELDFTGIVPSQFSVICTNGIIGASMISEFVKFGVKYGKPVLWDIPNVKTFIAAKQYHDSVLASEMQMGYWICDYRTVGTKKYAVYPSIKAALALANMFRKTGYLNYPLAGYDYAAVDAEELLETDADLYPAELKLAKINYISRRSAGPVIWEHRTGYAFESDLSYGSTVFTHLALASRCKAFVDNFPFKFITADLLILLRSGLEQAIQDYVQKNFIWSGEVVVPSFDEVKKNGAREMDLYINVKYAEDGQEYALNFHLKAKA